jgi:hypothetical protein
VLLERKEVQFPLEKVKIYICSKLGVCAGGAIMGKG